MQNLIATYLRTFSLFTLPQKMNRITTLMIPLLMLLAAMLPAQEKIYVFEHFTVDNGLPENSVTRILQDHLGFLWFGTQAGLVRYDGYNFNVYQPASDGPSGAEGSIITALAEGRGGNLWIGTLLNGLFYFERTTEQFTFYPVDSISSTFAVALIHVDQSDNVWIIIQPNFPEQVYHLHRLDRKTDTFTRYKHDPNDPGSISGDNVLVNRLFRKGHPAFYEDSKGMIWVGVRGAGLNRFDPATETFSHYRHNPQDPQSLGNEMVNHLFGDSKDNLWIATLGGLDRLDMENGIFTHYRRESLGSNSVISDTVNAVWEDRQGRIWIGAFGGVSRLEPETGLFTHYRDNRQNPKTPSSMWSAPINEDHEGKLWFLSWGADIALHSFDPETETFTRHADRSDPNGLHPGVALWGHLVDRSGILWIGTWQNGLNKVDPYRTKFRRHQPPYQSALTITHYKANSDIPNRLRKVLPPVISIYEDKKRYVLARPTSVRVYQCV